MIRSRVSCSDMIGFYAMSPMLAARRGLSPTQWAQIPVTWVPDYSEHIGNTFGPKGFANRLQPADSVVKIA